MLAKIVVVAAILVAGLVFAQREDLVHEWGVAGSCEGVRSPVDDGCPPVSQLWHWAREQRPDVRAAYPDHLGTDRIAFLRWTRSSGVAEFGVPASLLARAPA